jgi:ABC-type transport system substrate-binding protein
VKVRAIVAASALALLLSSVVAGVSRAGGASATGTVASVSHVLTIASAAVPTGFDSDAQVPGTQQTVFGGLNEPLLGYAAKKLANGNQVSDQSKLVGLLAQSWSEAKNKRSYTITLKHGIKSAFGHELTAKDVQWSFDKAFAENKTGASISKIALLTKVKAISKYQVRFFVSSPSRLILPFLALGVPAIYDSTEMKKHATASDPWALGWLKSNFAGFGAYTVQSVTAGSQAVFVANPHYYRGAPFFKTVIWREVDDPAVRLQLLKAGAVDMIDGPTGQDVASLRGDSNTKIHAVQSAAEVRILMNPSIAPFSNKLVRQALSYATPQTQIINTALSGYATPMKGPVPATVPGYDPSSFPYKYNLAKAKQLLSQAGYANGLTVTLTYSTLASWEEGVAIQLKNAWDKAGVNVKLQAIPSAQMKTAGGATGRNLALFSYPDTPFISDPAYALGVYYDPAACCDRNAYNNPQVTSLLHQLERTTDDAAAAKVTKKIQQLINGDAPTIFIAQIDALAATRKNIVGYVNHVDNQPRWAELSRTSR